MADLQQILSSGQWETRWFPPQDSNFVPDFQTNPSCTGSSDCKSTSFSIKLLTLVPSLCFGATQHGTIYKHVLYKPVDVCQISDMTTLVVTLYFHVRWVRCHQIGVDLQAFWRRVPRWDPGFLNGRHGPSLPWRPWRPWPLSGERSRCVPQGCAGGWSGWEFPRWLRKTSWLFPTKHTFEWIDTEKPTMVKHPPSWDSWCVEVIATKHLTPGISQYFRMF